MNFSIQNILIVLLAGVVLWAVFFRTVEPEVREIKVPVSLTPHQLDSMGLSIEAKVKGTLKPIIKTEKVRVEDTAKVRSLINEIISLKDSLKGKAELPLEYHGFVGPSKDTLDVVAEFVNDTISVVFRPVQRNFEVVYRDTVESRGFFDRLSIGPGIGLTVEDGQANAVIFIGLSYDIFGK